MKKLCVDDIKIIRQWFQKYQDWKYEAMRKKPRTHSIRIDDLPKSKSISPDQAMIEYTNATNECKQRTDLLKLMEKSEGKGPLYAEIIEKRYLRNWSLTKTNLYLNEKHHLFISLRNLERYEHNGLLLALDLVK